ncbi:glycosyltransferase [Spirosoma sp. KNUC1025]|uniref:glycosyltransferase n=1 Tax=Spirosoma sp. KNUC1025 TaxID=2894082 RepID=UPI00387074B0|nr:glycosyltransferase [Spirosoma sp. KNUC1025]
MAEVEANSILVSVIITCYNHGRFLKEAINSVLQQTWSAIEIVVVDDGSTDDTRAVSESYPDVVYVYQVNQGLSAARNTGAAHSTGKYLVFLDADDWLYPDGIEFNVNELEENPEAVFVSGAYRMVDVNNTILYGVTREIDEDHYCRMLESNYIGMHGTVMYRRWLFDTYQFDTSLRSCEDYDLYLKITRSFPVVHHTHQIAAYRMHTTNMSGNIPFMLDMALLALSRQEQNLRTNAEKRSYRKGQQFWRAYYGWELQKRLRFDMDSPKMVPRELAKQSLRKHQPYIYYYSSGMRQVINIIKKVVPTFGQRWLHQAKFFPSFIPEPGKVQTGDFRRVRPFSTEFGYDRGGPVDRYYIENFLKKNEDLIKGRVLEIGDNAYTMQFGGSRVVQSDVLHVHSDNPMATFVGDLSDAPQIPSDSFDCIVLTQTLHLIYNMKGAIETCYRILKPGGVLLLTVPGISHIDHDEWNENWLWAFTAGSLRRVLSEAFPVSYVDINTFGNVFIATAFLYGMGLSEVTKYELDWMDPHYQVIITAKAVKPQAS